VVNSEELIMEMRNEQGSTLIEAIFAMLILAIIIVGLNAGVISMIKMNLASKELSAATSNAYSLFEDLRNKNYSDIESDMDVVASKYMRSWVVSTGGSQKTIDVYILWPVSTMKHQIQLSTIIAKP
jgi:Tfp pilus assembly protein PilV